MENGRNGRNGNEKAEKRKKENGRGKTGKKEGMKKFFEAKIGLLRLCMGGG